jgi:hypothetical protein
MQVISAVRDCDLLLKLRRLSSSLSMAKKLSALS